MSDTTRHDPAPAQGRATPDQTSQPGETVSPRFRLSRALGEMETIFDNALVGMALIRNGRIHKINTRGAAIVGQNATDLLGKEAASLFPSQREYQAFTQVARQHPDASDQYVGECRMRCQPGRECPVRLQIKVVGGPGHEEDVIWTFDDVAEQKRLEEELVASKRAAEAASVAKSQFLANMSHELRTPLNGILGMTQLLLDGEVQGETREYLGIIRQSADVLLHIVSDLLDLSNVEAGRIVVQRREFDPRAEFTPLLRNFAAQSQPRPFTFAYHIEPGVPARLIGDPNRIKQILIHLLGNAFKYTRTGQVTARIGPTTAGAARTGSAARRIALGFTVDDTGIGIEPGRQKTIFEPFDIGEDYLTKKYSGAGLGLAIAKRLATMMGGTISLTSKPDRGSSFTLTLAFDLPLDARPDRPDRVVPPKPPSRPLRILLAEDEPVNRMATSRTLQKLGHAVTTAIDGREALALLGQTPYDLVLMDIQMPGLNGLEATRIIRSGQVPGIAPAIPVVALTAYALESDKDRGLEAGMDEYVVKPFDTHELLQAMERALAKEGLPPTPAP